MQAQHALQSSNPVLNDADTFNQFYGEMAGTAQREDVTTVQGVVNKTAILVLVAVGAGAAGYAISEMIGFGVVTISAIVSLIVTLGIFFKLRGNPAQAVFLAPVYAIVQGFFLGALTGMFEGILKQMNIAAAGGLALQAFIITLSVMLAMLGLYYLRILRPTRMFVAVVSTLTVGVMITYLLSFVAALVFGVNLPFISVMHGVQEGGTALLIGIGINVLILGIAAMYLIIDFGLVEEKVKSGAPRSMEWYCAFALIVTLAWIYFEALKLAFRLAILFANRD
jgi:uncharacterized YccA/Bax inhibitor family protein